MEALIVFQILSSGLRWFPCFLFHASMLCSIFSHQLLKTRSIHNVVLFTLNNLSFPIDEI